jgi:hypothetical protein
MPPHEGESDEGKCCESRPCEKGCLWPEPIPEQARDHTCGQEGKSAHQVEHAIGSPTQLRRRGIRHESGEQPWCHAQMQAPERYANSNPDKPGCEGEHEIGMNFGSSTPAIGDIGNGLSR